MKRLLFPVLMATILITACSKKEGPAGPEGQAGANGNANVKVFEKDISTATWTATGAGAGNYLWLDVNAPTVLTSAVLEKNTILVYVYTSDFQGWGIVPYNTERNIRVTAEVGVGKIRLKKDQNGYPSTQSWHNKVRLVLIENTANAGALNNVLNREIATTIDPSRIEKL